MRNTKGRHPIYKWRSLGEQEGRYDGKTYGGDRVLTLVNAAPSLTF